MARAKDSVRIVHPSPEMAGGGSNALPEWCQTFKMRGEVKKQPDDFYDGGTKPLRSVPPFLTLVKGPWPLCECECDQRQPEA